MFVTNFTGSAYGCWAGLRKGKKLTKVMLTLIKHASGISFLCVSLLGETKNFSVWESDKSTPENLCNEKSYHSTHSHSRLIASRTYRITSGSRKFAWSELLMNQRERKISLIQGTETKRTHTNMHPNFFIAIGALLNYAVECKQFGVRIMIY